MKRNLLSCITKVLLIAAVGYGIIKTCGELPGYTQSLAKLLTA